MGVSILPNQLNQVGTMIVFDFIILLRNSHVVILLLLGYFPIVSNGKAVGGGSIWETGLTDARAKATSSMHFRTTIPMPPPLSGASDDNVTIVKHTFLHHPGAGQIIQNGYNLPLLPPLLPTATSVDQPEEAWGKHIPRRVWIAVRNISDERPSHMKGFIERNSNWTIHFCDNQEKDAFIEKVYANTSIEWAYKILNPAIGCSRVEIWRLAVLYAYGGMYMDDDANVGTPLDEIIRDDDKLIFGQEGYNWDDRCYIDEYPISNHSLNVRFGNEANSKIFFNNKFFFNWAIFAAPRHPIIYRVLQHAVELIKREYLGDSAIKMATHDHRGKLLMCATTFPITLAAREIVLSAGTVGYDIPTPSTMPPSPLLANDSLSLSLSVPLSYNFSGLGLRIGGLGFQEYKAEMKAWFNDYKHDHWVKMIHKRKTPYLLEYAPPRLEKFEGKVIQAPGQREIFLVTNGTRRGFPNLDTFIAMNFDLEQVQQVPHAIMELIQKGPLLEAITKEH